MAITRTMAIDRAIDVIKTALASGTIKLRGADYETVVNEANVKTDSDYINGLINAISENILQEGKRRE